MEGRKKQAEQTEFAIITKAKDLVKHTFLMTNERRFPKKYRFTIVNRLHDLTIDIFQHIQEANELDIVENPKELKIKPVEAALLPRTLGDVDAAVINGNYALQAGLNSADALILEGAQSPYANILVVQSSKVDDENLQKLKKALQSQKVKDFIQEKYKGEIVPAF